MPDARLDGWLERSARALARRTSRRSFLTRLGRLLLGVAAFKLHPVGRAGAADDPPDDGELPGPLGDPGSCDYWRHCAIDGFLCSCCGGSHTACPPGTEMAAVTWIGTCRNPTDGRDYVISYNDCCGKGFCGRCLCNRNEGERPVYVVPKNNDINWCVGASSTAYHCSTAVILGVTSES